jgi:GT2 family glycosyltransferase/glycosyltransferase involved in cell wall biosynthesis
MDDRPTALRAEPSRNERDVIAAGEDSHSGNARRILPGEGKIARLERWARRPLRALRRGLAPRAFALTPSPHAQPIPAPRGWETVGTAPRFALSHGTNRFPEGWVAVDLVCEVEEGCDVVPRLLARCGSSGPEFQVLLPRVELGRSRGVVKLPEGISELSLEPVGRSARFRIGPLHVRELPRAVAAAMLVAPRLARYAKNPARSVAAMSEAWGVYRARGWTGVKRHFRDATAPRLGAPTREIARAIGPRVAVLTLRLSKGYGVDVVVARQIEHLCARGYEVTAVVVETDGHHDASLAPYVDAGQLRVVSVGSPEEAAREVVRQGAAIAIAETPPFFDTLSLLPPSVVRVIFDHGEPPAELFPDADVRRGIASRKVDVSRGVDLSIAISRFIQQDSRLQDAHVCFNGNDHLLRRRSNLARVADRFRRSHGLSDTFIVLNVTRFLADERRYKGADDYAAVREALVRLRPDLADSVRFVLAGRSAEADRAWATARGLLAVSNPTDDELVAAYLDSDLYLTTSRWEGYNLGLAQALALGVPSLASARGAHPEFPVRTSDDPEVLARWIIEEVERASGAVRSPLQRLRRATVYPWRDAAHRLETLVAESVSRRGPAAPNLPPPLKVVSEEAPELSVIILSKDRPDLIVPCLHSIEQRLDVPYEILVGDTGSTDPETLRFYETTPHQVHYLGHYNFSVGNNILAARARGRYLLFLNNDTALIETSFRTAIDFLAAHPRVGCVGGYLLYADRTIQHAGVRICTRPPPYHGVPEHLDRLQAFDTYPGRAAPREVVAVTGAMLLVEAVTFARAGGFDEIFVEEAQDIDLCLRLRREGRSSFVHPSLVAYHYENSTRTVKESPRDRAEFLRRFGALIEGELLEWQARHGLSDGAGEGR